jgi:hypothetical protein
LCVTSIGSSRSSAYAIALSRVHAKSVPAGRLHQVLGDQRPAERRHQRVAVHVERVGPQRRHAEVRGELGARVDDHRLDGAAGQGALPDRLEVLAALAHVEGDRDHLGARLVGEVRNRDGRVEAAGVGKDDPVSHWTFPSES